MVGMFHAWRFESHTGLVTEGFGALEMRLLLYTAQCKTRALFGNARLESLLVVSFSYAFSGS